MYRELPLTSFKLFNQFTENYVDFVRCLMNTGNTLGATTEEITKGTHQTSDSLAELTELRQQVQLLTQKIERLEKNKKTAHWNRSGKGHWRT